MRCIECGDEAVALCPSCLVGQCEPHFIRSRASRLRASALGGCEHPDRAPMVAVRFPARQGQVTD